MAKKTWTREELANLTMEQVEKQLNDKQRLFVQEYLRDLNGTQAAIRAGYSEKDASSTACKLLRKPEIAEYRDRKIKEIFDSRGITPEFIQLSCFEIYCRCMQKEPVMGWNSELKMWAPSGEWSFDAKGALKALDQMATLLGMKRQEDPNAPKNSETLEQYLAKTGGNQRQF